MSDWAAAETVRIHFRGRHNSPALSAAQRELIRVMGTYPLPSSQIGTVIHLADTLFFAGHLSSRVEWRWSSRSDPCFITSIVGRTELRHHATPGHGYQTRITLSKPILKSERYDQRLLFSAILHEAIHAYLFVQRGFAATEEGGHTQGFRRIAQLIDDWVGDQEFLQLYNVEASLEDFRRLMSCPAFAMLQFADPQRYGQGSQPPPQV
ncbi:MAG: hypothetical protein M1817_000265 [Caeruleum heppii]|nr:MAG: hypothetical protein M1817_000265 [Caeruleum heppii]